MQLDLARIRNLRPQQQIHYLPSVGSTMTEAARLLAEGAPHGTLVIAEQQTAGIGRLGRSWISEPQAGLYLSVLLRLPLSPANLPIASLVLGLATAEAIHKATHVACDLRWPNDVLIGERKVAGILTHLVENFIIAGIGINVNQCREDFPAELQGRAISLAMALGRQVDRQNFAVALLRNLDLTYREKFSKTVAAFNSSPAPTTTHDKRAAKSRTA